MSLCLFVSDLHGSAIRVEKLFCAIRRESPAVVLIGGDLLPFTGRLDGTESFVEGVLGRGCRTLRAAMGRRYPLVGVILGNDDPRREEAALRQGEREGLWRYLHGRRIRHAQYSLYGYACIPPTPFLLKDWERYDVSRFVDVGAIPPTAGWRSVPPRGDDIEYGTIRQDLERLVGHRDLARAVFLFHAPPYGTVLDRADLDGRLIDHAPVDVHIGSIAIRHFIEERRPYLTLHGHAHESARLTGSWRERIGNSWSFSAAHDGPELALVSFPLGSPGSAQRTLL